MCVIMLASNKPVTEEMCGKAFAANSDGAGIAWRDANGKVVHWKKGLTLDQIIEECATRPLPYVAHFRIQTVGGKVPTLCHPFPIMKDVPLTLTGSTPGYVLFHNGHWGRWKDLTLEGAFKRGNKIPPGIWSDTRAMALAAHNLGLGALNFIGEKAIAFGPATIEIFEGPSFTEEDGVWCSNLNWKNRFYRGKTSTDADDEHGAEYGDGMGGFYGVHRPSVYCRYTNCTQMKPTGFEFCVKHMPDNERERWLKELEEKDKGTHALVVAGEANRNKSTGVSVGGVPVSKLPFREGEVAVRDNQSGEPKTVEEGTKEGKSASSETGATIIVTDPDEAINFVRRLNPKGFRSHTPVGVDRRAQGFIDTRNGLVRARTM